MKINFTKKLLTIKGEEMKMTETSPLGLTLEDVALNGILAPVEPGANNLERATRNFKLALRISNSPQGCEISSEEAVILKESIGRVFNYAPAICGPVELFLEGEAHVL